MDYRGSGRLVWASSLSLVVFLWICSCVVVVSQSVCSDPEATCPNCTLPHRCLADPCRVTICRASPGARCEADLCEGCRAKFFDSRDREITNTCNNFKACSRNRGSNLKIPCSWDNRDVCTGEAYCDVDPFGRFSTCCCNKRVAKCPGCTLPLRCPSNPCRGAMCESFPEANCKADLCKGCQPFFFDSAGNNVTDQCSTILQPCSRSGGIDMNISCSSTTEGACPSRSYCDVDPRGRFSTCCCPATTICGQHPCARSSCPAYPEARCVQKCGSCDPLYMLDDGTDVTANCYTTRPCAQRGGHRTGSTCWRGSSCGDNQYCDSSGSFAECCCTEEACSPDPCDSASCPAHPQATCIASSCNDCTPKFFKNGRDVTSLCCNQDGYTFKSNICYDNRCLDNGSACTRAGGFCVALSGRKLCWTVSTTPPS
jgi:hypothetical protein